MRAAVYTRVSSQEQVNEGLSLDLQRHRCEERARADGAVTVEVFEDGGISGGKAGNRPKLQKLLKHLADYDALYIFKLDRLARSVRDTEDILKACQAADVRLVSLAENIDLGTAMGRFFVFMVALFAQMELERITERVRDSVAERRRQGRRFGRPPLGYKPNPANQGKVKGKPMVVDPERVPLVREIFARYVSGESITQLTHWLNATHGPIGWGTRWRNQATMKILSNPAYVGMMKDEDGEIVPSKHKGIIDPEVWRQAQERLRDNAIIAPAARARSLSPVFRCGLCGGPMKTQHNGPAEDQRAFGCTRRAELPKEERHPATWVSTPKALALTWQAVSYLISEDAIAEAQARQESEDDDAARKALLRERQKLEDDIAYNLAAARAGGIDVALLARENAPLNARLEEVVRTLSKQQETRQKLAQLQTVTAEEVLAAVQSGDVENQRRFLLRFFQRVEVHQGFLRFVPTVPEVPAFDVEVPKYYAPKRGGRLAEVPFCLLSGNEHLCEGKKAN